jgi:hypothetical protein
MKNYVDGRVTLDSEKIQDAIREKLLKGGKLFDLKANHTLIISLGGTGIRFGAETKRMLTKRYGEEALAKRVKFLFIDIDESELEGKNIETAEWFSLSNSAVRSFPANGYPEFIKKWINMGIRPEYLENGAGGIRMGGRCLLLTNIRDMQDRLHDILNKFYMDQGQANITQTNVFILSGLSGGTGSGTFIDMAFIIRKVATAFDLVSLKLFGFFELPDATIRRQGRLDDVTKNSHYGNACAALQELQYFMQKRESDGKNPYRIRYGNDLNDYEYNREVFDRVVLLSSESTVRGAGGSSGFVKDPVVTGPLESKQTPYVTKAIPEIINLLISEPAGINERNNGDDNYFKLASQLSNISPGFCSAGVSKLEVASDKIILCIVARMFFELKARWNLIPTYDAVQELYDFVDVEGLQSEINSMLNGAVNRETDRDIGQEIATDVRSNFTGRVNRDINHDAWSGELREKIKGYYLEKGPFYTGRLIVAVIIKLNLYFNDRSGIQNVGYEAALSDYLRANIFSRGNAKKNLISSLKKHFQPLVHSETVKHGGRRVEIMTNLNNRIYQPITKMIESFSQVLEAVTAISSDTMRNTYSGGEVFSWNLSEVSYADINTKIANMFKKTVCFADETPPLDVTETLYVLKDGENGDPIFHFDGSESGERISVQTESNAIPNKEVVSIKNKIVFKGTEVAFDFEDSVKGLLNNIWSNIEADNQDILDLLIIQINDIASKIVSEEFEQMMLMLSDREDLSKKADVDDKTKERLFKKALEQFFKFSLPSFPLLGHKLDGRGTEFSLTIRPSIKDPVFINALNSEQKIGGSQAREIPQSPTMLNVSVYFGLDLSSYRYIKECREGYEWRKTYIDANGKEYWPGTHLSEGAEYDWDWRTFMPEIYS